jgi:hypothetical protein
MNLNTVVRLAYSHPDNSGLSIRALARLLDINPGTVYRTLVQLHLVKAPARKRQRSKSAAGRVKMSRLPRPVVNNPTLRNIYDELEMSRARRVDKKNCPKQRQQQRA